MDKFSYISNAHPDYIESLYQDFQSNPESVDEEFKKFFEGFEFATTNFSTSNGSFNTDELKVFRLIQAYRNRGHLVAKTNPLQERKDRAAHLNIEHFGLSGKDLKRTFQIGSEINVGAASLETIIDHLQKAYCSSLGFEYNYIRHREEKQWFREKIEGNPHFKAFSLDKKKSVLRQLNKAVVFENFLGKKYIGEKRFSIEGAETAVPALLAMIDQAAATGTKEVVIGMAHRGRLNVLANVMGKTYEDIFSEFEGNIIADETFGDGDVKYHLGFSSLHTASNGDSVYLKLAPNPSHLEAVDPVVCGYTRAKADVNYDSDYDKILPVLIHGDAAVAGQGIVYEVLQMAKLEGYSTGGTIHFVINNQIGFTTDFDDARSSDYCTSIAATTHVPVIHVNGEDVDAVIYAAEMAAEYRAKFNKDIFIDMVCYRKHGHNEGDDPKYTQPGMYKLIAQHQNVRDIYSKELAERGEVEAEIAKKLDKEFWNELQERLDMAKQKEQVYKPQPPELEWKKTRRAKPEDFEKSPKTAITKAQATKVIKALVEAPDGFTPLRKVDKYLQGRREIMQKNKTVDWAAAELLAYGSILLEGKNVRMSGQDVKRGTFSHRHAVIFDTNTYEPYNRLAHISKKQGEFMIYNSHLSEYGVLGFEYGYALTHPHNLVIWEAQFGDFTNNAQTIVDQYISSSESKWQLNCGLVMLLPHGYEGQGPEHSSARLERFLQNCAEFNMVVTNITTPSNLFHAFRRQLEWPFRKPLINMSPKSLLRDKRCQSPIDDIFKGGFNEIIDDPNVKQPKKVKRILFCTGKIYYDLEAKKLEDKRDDIAIVRMEQLYPIAYDKINSIIAQYGDAELYWVQEEPMNMGAWTFILNRFYGKMNFKCIARKTSASPATGFKKQHIKEQADIINRAFN